MNIYYNAAQNIRSDQQSSAALRAKIRTWEKRGYLPEGWVKLTESEPVYDDSLLTGPKELTIDESGTTYSWTVDGVRWDQCVDAVADARKKCRKAIDAVIDAGRVTVVPFTLPQGALLDGIGAAGQVVNLPAVHPVDGDDYWPRVAVSMELKTRMGTMSALERFGAIEGRIDIPAAEVMPMFALLLPKLSGALTGRLDLEDKFSKAVTADQFDAVRHFVEDAE